MGAYRVIAAESPEALEAEEPLLWDTGRVERGGEANVLLKVGDGGPGGEILPARVEYDGRALRSRDQVWWKVRVWDGRGRDGGWSEPAHFSIGLLDESEWKAEWIGLDDEATEPLSQEVREQLRTLPWIRARDGSAEQESEGGKIAFFRREIELPAEPIESAWLAATADMIADLRINGEAVIDEWGRDHEQLARWEPVRPIDIARQLRPGRNVIAIRVENHDGLPPALSGMVVVQSGGLEHRLLLDDSWRVAGGEAAPAWDDVGFDDIAWPRAETASRQPWGSARNTEHFMPRAPFLRKPFRVEKRDRLTRATLYATALGVYEPRLNGRRVAAREFAPGWTEYARRVEHQTYDVTELIQEGDNCLGAILGDGWYAGLLGYTGRRRFYQQVGGGPARWLAQLELEFKDGTRQTVATGPDWRASFGPILYADNYMGSAVDSRLAMPGWDTAGFDASDWRPVETGFGPVEQRRADVTARLAASMQQGRVSLIVGPSALGADPAYGIVKTLHVEYELDGKPRQVSLREGERLELPPEGEPGDVRIVKAVFAEPTPAAPSEATFKIEPARGEPIRRFEELPAQSVTEPRPGRYVFDLGQNMVGWVRLQVDGEAGQRLTVRHAEMLNPDGTLYTSNLRGATATDFFTLKGGPETLEPPFTFHGFRYVEITGLRTRPETTMVTGIVAHTAMRPAGTFTCSNPLINQLVHNIVWGQKGNYFDIPTDCPQRDERLGWTGDAQFFMNTAAYTFDIASFMSRWLNTLIQDSQFDDGTFAHVAPKANERGGSTAWGDAAIVCTYAQYQTYADARIIRDHWPNLLRYMDWLDSRTTDGIARVGGYGDWVNLNDPTSKDLIDTAYRAELCRMMAEMAVVIDAQADAARFEADRETTLRAFQRRFISEDGALRESGQTGYALAFTMGLIPQELRAQAADHFEQAIAARDWHLATGFIGTPRLLPGLHAAGKTGVAARLLLNEDYPSWLYQVKLGATTMWERWDGWTPERGFQDVNMNSFNHYAFGSVGDYLYRYIAGIAPLAPGYSRIFVAPTLTPGLDHVSATHDAVVGTIGSAWRRTNNGMEYEIEIPPNTTAEIRLPHPREAAAAVTESGSPLDEVDGVVLLKPDGKDSVLRLHVQSGRYRFRISD